MEGCNYERGLAFIVEGDTERVFYEEYLEKLCSEKGLAIEKNVDAQQNLYVVSDENRSIVVIIHNVSSVTQMTNSVTWFRFSCLRVYGDTPWYVFLCYDTDSYSEVITEFYEGDWLRLRKAIEKEAESVTDLAAKADIEDVMLCDKEGVLAFLGLNPETEVPHGRKGKAKMKKLYRMVAINNSYHEGDRARTLIRSLDMGKIEESAPIPLTAIRLALGFH